MQKTIPQWVTRFATWLLNQTNINQRITDAVRATEGSCVYQIRTAVESEAAARKAMDDELANTVYRNRTHLDAQHLALEAEVAKQVLRGAERFKALDMDLELLGVAQAQQANNFKQLDPSRAEVAALRDNLTKLDRQRQSMSDSLNRAHGAISAVENWRQRREQLYDATARFLEYALCAFEQYTRRHLGPLSGTGLVNIAECPRCGKYHALLLATVDREATAKAHGYTMHRAKCPHTKLTFVLDTIDHRADNCILVAHASNKKKVTLAYRRGFLPSAPATQIIDSGYYAAHALPSGAIEVLYPQRSDAVDGSAATDAQLRAASGLADAQRREAAVRAPAAPGAVKAPASKPVVALPAPAKPSHTPVRDPRFKPLVGDVVTSTYGYARTPKFMTRRVCAVSAERQKAILWENTQSTAETAPCQRQGMCTLASWQAWAKNGQVVATGDTKLGLITDPTTLGAAIKQMEAKV